MGKGRIWEGGGRRFLRGQTAAIPSPACYKGQGASHGSAPGLGSFFQVSGTDAQEEEATPGDGEGLGGLCFSGVLTLGWEGSESPACPSQKEQLPPRPVPPRTESSWPVGAAVRHGARALSQSLFCSGQCGQAIRLGHRCGKRAAGREKMLPGQGTKAGLCYRTRHPVHTLPALSLQPLVLPKA